MNVRRMRDEETPRGEPRTVLGRAILRYAMWESPGAIVLILVLAQFYTGFAGPAPADPTPWAAAAFFVFVIYAVALFVRIVVPAIKQVKGSSDAR